MRPTTAKGNRWDYRELRLKPINSQQGQHPLKDRPDADQHDEQFEKVCQSTVVDELFDGPKTDCADDANK